ncbi:hypothetical protein [Chryseolinea soli]|uniref:hypothetical protein n=1 Tax=Chryseolinea soli TaxID=2321403 RepID=UPI00135C6608|nr:hypothetical protein [Chryseolinea soli]
MTDQTASTNANSRVSTLGKKVIRVSLLLSGVEVIRTLIPYLVFITDSDFGWAMVNYGYSPYMGNVIAGGVVYAMMRRNPVAIPVSILACVYPAYGGVMYLLSTSLLQDDE